MTLRHLLIFKTIAETGSFTKAAEALYITQSAVSHAVKELEEQAKTPLFDRMSKQVHMTESGRLFLEEILPLLSSFELLESRMGKLEQQAPLHLVSSITIASYWLPRILREFKKQWRELPVSVEVVRAAAAIGTLREGKADLALLEGAVPQGPFESLPFAFYSMCVLCAPDYEGGSGGSVHDGAAGGSVHDGAAGGSGHGGAAGERRMDLGGFCGERLLLREKGSAIRDALDSALYLAGYTAYPSWCSVNSNALIEAAKAGLGLTVLPEILVRDALKKGDLVTVQVEGLSLKNEMLAVWHREKHMSAPLLDFLSLIQKCST